MLLQLLVYYGVLQLICNGKRQNPSPNNKTNNIRVGLRLSIKTYSPLKSL